MAERATRRAVPEPSASRGSRARRLMRLEYEDDGLAGVAQAQVWPRFTYQDALLHLG